MLQPLASLWRHPARTVFYDAAGLVGQAYAKNEGLSPHRAMAKRRRFGSIDDAIHYLRYWLGEADARAELRWTLHRCSPSSVCTASSPDAWINSLAQKMVSGSLIVIEEPGRAGTLARLRAPASAEATASVDVEALPELNSRQFSFVRTSPAALAPADVGTTVLAQSYWSTSAEDQIAQAESLEAAARSGVPFCEICASQSRLQNADDPNVKADSPDTENAASTWASNQIAQADSLETAAKNGTPFCEICEQLKSEPNLTQEPAHD